MSTTLALRRLNFGVPARLWATGKLNAVLPVEDYDLLEAANPIGEDGIYYDVDEKTREAREDFMVREMLKRGGVSVIVLGAGHDFGDNVRRMGECEYFRVAINGYVAATE